MWCEGEKNFSFFFFFQVVFTMVAMHVTRCCSALANIQSHMIVFCCAEYLFIPDRWQNEKFLSQDMLSKSFSILMCKCACSRKCKRKRKKKQAKQEKEQYHNFCLFYGISRFFSLLTISSSINSMSSFCC